MSKFIEGEYYHIYNRGNSKQKIFHDNEDYERFLKFLYLSNSTKRVKFREDIVKKKLDAFDFERGDLLVDVCTYVLMPNHFHIVLSPATKDFGGKGLEKFMQKLEGAYVRYYNSKYKRTGSLFESNFKFEHLNNDQYFKYIFSYIHLNPVKLIQSDWKERGVSDIKKVKNFLETFVYSSYLDYLNLNKGKSSNILNKSFYINYFGNKLNFEKDLLVWLSFKQPPKTLVAIHNS